ncbi:hypothetical protein N9N67_05785 [Bacteriovoracaceae bacterium]|nr:hypothetical protein [Bacteriovoracaceae bacterium]
MRNLIKNVSLIFVFIIISTLVSCQSEEKNKNERAKISPEVKQEIINLFQTNESLHSSFFDYNAEQVEKSALELKMVISKIKSEQVNKILLNSVNLLSEIKAINEREQNNITYHKISLELITLLKSIDLGSIYNAYSCPMVKKKWVQNSQKKKRVHNPYDPSMPYCGAQDTRY